MGQGCDSGGSSHYPTRVQDLLGPNHELLIMRHTFLCRLMPENMNELVNKLKQKQTAHSLHLSSGFLIMEIGETFDMESTPDIKKYVSGLPLLPVFPISPLTGSPIPDPDKTTACLYTHIIITHTKHGWVVKS